MMIGLVNDDLDQPAVGIFLEASGEINADFFGLLGQLESNLDHSLVNGVVSIIGGPSSKQDSKTHFDEFTDHLQNHATKENKWITSSVPIQRNSSATSVTIQIIGGNNISEKLKDQSSSFSNYNEIEDYMNGIIKKNIQNIIVIVNREFRKERKDDAHFYLLNIFRECLNLEFGVFNGDNETLSFLHEVAQKGHGKIALVENSGGISDYLILVMFDQKKKINVGKRLSCRNKASTGYSKKMIMDLKAYQSMSKSIRLYRKNSQFLDNFGPSCLEIFSSPFFYISDDQIFQVLETAFSRNEVELVELFYSRFSSDDLDQREFASPERMERLYLSQMHLVKEESLANLAGLKDGFSSENTQSYDVYESVNLSKLIEDFESSLISTNWNPFARLFKNRRGGKFASRDIRLREGFESHDPEERLFCWAMLFEYWDLANLIWLRSKYGISLALVGANFLRGAAGLRRASDMLASDRLLEFANYYENTAIEAFSKLKESPPLGEKELPPQLLLVSANNRMGHMTLLKMASSGNCSNFIAQSGVQEFLSSIWRGNFALKEKVWKIAGCVIFFWLPFLPSLILDFKNAKRNWFQKWIDTLTAPITVFMVVNTETYLY